MNPSDTSLHVLEEFAEGVACRKPDCISVAGTRMGLWRVYLEVSEETAASAEGKVRFGSVDAENMSLGSLIADFDSVLWRAKRLLLRQRHFAVEAPGPELRAWHLIAAQQLIDLG